ncbi:MAG: hypothetical protein JJU36_18090 [Phycisphaeraceae bacterium]|nr:hypothetical protein [Phycisphaeraceae bacterium]
MPPVFFNAQHSPIGAFASFTLGFPGARGGLGLELGKPANQSVFIGLESDQPHQYDVLPFYKDAEDEARRYDVEAVAPEDHQPKSAARLKPFAEDDISRDYQLCLDVFRAGDLTFRIVSPVLSVPDPRGGEVEELKRALLPAVLAEIEVDNRKGKSARRVFFGYQGNDPYSAMRRIDDRGEGRLRGVGQGNITAIMSDDPRLHSALAFSIEQAVEPKIDENVVFGLGGVGALVGMAPAGEVSRFRFAICFHRGGTATSGQATRYYYTRFFQNIEQVGDYALAHFNEYLQLAEDAQRRLDASRLSEAQRFQFIHAVHSYYGSTQFLDWLDEDHAGEPYWVVNEGEYRMMNTFDLTADHLYFEMKMNPWTVRNELEWFIRRYSYRDEVRFPGESKAFPGGISFTHDQGIANHISRPAYSTYELFGLSGCFSHMTHEQLVNWAVCATTYLHGSGDDAFYTTHRQVFLDVLQSLENRDHPNPSQRNGIMGLDSSRTMGGAEITTYDSLDASLGQARNNLYMAVKTWAAYVTLGEVFHRHGDGKQADAARQQAQRATKTLVSAMREDGYIPGVMFEGNDSKIIPAIEGLVFPVVAGCPEAIELDGPYAELLQTLIRHLKTVLKPGACLFDDGGWKLSSTSNNSWLSKIYLCQFVYRRVLKLPWDDAGRRADDAHVRWLLNPQHSAYWAWSDQMISGEAWGSKYYPRGVTSVLWLEE